MRRSNLALPAMLLAILVLAGCTATAAPDNKVQDQTAAAQPASAKVDYPFTVPVVDPVGYPGYAKVLGTLDPGWYSAPAGWAEQGKTLWVTTKGAGKCVSVPSSIEMLSSSEIVVEFTAASDDCEDQGLTTHELDVPDGVTSGLLTVSFRFVRVEPPFGIS